MGLKLTVVTGSRADYGLLEYPIKLLEADPFFELNVRNIWGLGDEHIFSAMCYRWPPDLLLVLGDRCEIMMTVLGAHLNRVPIAHIAGGDVTEGSYDDAMRDAISRMASLHFVTSTSAMARLTHMGYHNIHLVGNPAIDYIKNMPWKKERPYPKPYVVVSYQPETLTGEDHLDEIIASLPAGKLAVFIMPNPDRGSEEIREQITAYCSNHTLHEISHEALPHAEFLNLIYHCDEFIGNSSSMLYEAPELGVKIRMVGKRQRGRVIPWGDGKASERMLKIMKYTAGTL